jgi:hypothetical protein
MDFERRFYIVRVIRLAKALRGFQIGEHIGGATILAKTLIQSSPALIILSFFAIIAIVIFGSVIYFFESGTFEVTTGYSEGAYMRKNIFTGTREESPYLSIASSMYWAVAVSVVMCVDTLQLLGMCKSGMRAWFCL